MRRSALLNAAVIVAAASLIALTATSAAAQSLIFDRHLNLRGPKAPRPNAAHVE